MELKLNLKEKYKKLENILKKYNSAIVAFSGGVDSSFLLYMCKVVGLKVLAVTAVSQTYSKDELKEAKRFVKKYDIEHKIVFTDEFLNSKFVKNDLNRCFYCKSELFCKLTKIKEEKSFDIIFDGTNYDDTKLDHRPGRLAAKMYQIKSPLLEAKLTKKEIRLLSKKFNLPTFNKPQMACLSSRIPYGEKIDEKNISQIALTEKVIKTFWKKFFRARWHKEVLRIEVEKDKIEEFIKKVDINLLTKKLHRIGYKFVTLDLDGYIPAGMREKMFKVAHSKISKLQ
jgi:uncharacterized protein